jgi:menaquinone-specific isochorismate synthase
MVFDRSGFLFPDPAGHFWWGQDLTWQRRRLEGDRAAHLYSPDFFLGSETPWARAATCVKLSRAELLAMLRPGTATDLRWHAPDPDGFRSDFENLQSEIRAGRLEKAVPVTFESASGFSPDKLPSLLANLLRQSEGLPLHVFGVWDESGGILGATPEVLFDYDGHGAFRAMALAGTRPHQDSGHRLALLEDPKERREHQLVVRGILSSLQSLGFSAAQAQVGGVEELRLPTFSHLRTWVDLALTRPLEFEAMIEALHPTPALGAFPREAGLEWLRAREAQALARGLPSRDRYGAPFGFMLPGGAVRCLVAIRAYLWDARGLRLGSGCGVIAESELEREWAELRSKRESVKRLFAGEASP